MVRYKYRVQAKSIDLPISSFSSYSTKNPDLGNEVDTGCDDDDDISMAYTYKIVKRYAFIK